MAASAVYTFKGGGEQHHVYTHSYGYPSYAWNFFDATLKSGLALELPFYVSEDFAAAFIAANKQRGGDVCTQKSRRKARDVEYGYLLWQAGDGKLMVKVTAIDGWRAWKETILFRGPLSELIVSEGRVAE